MISSKCNLKMSKGHFILFFYGVLQIPIVVFAKDMIRNDQLCPDPTFNGNREERAYFSERSVQVIYVPVGGLVKSKEGAQEDIPCSFIDTSNIGKPTGVQRVTIRAAELSHSPWNYTGASRCRSFIKFRMSKPSTNETQLCRMYKIYNPGTGFQNATSPPALWTGPNYNIKFSLPYPTVSSDAGNSENKSTYLHVVYKVWAGQRCILKVQQYVLNPLPSECDSAGLQQQQLCGTYDCSEQHRLLKKLGFIPYDVVVNIDNLLGTYMSGKDRNGFHRLDYDSIKNYDIERRDGDLYFKPKRNYHAALFSGMTRAISFLFVLSVLISCISYQLKPYLRPSSSFESDPVRERGHENHRRCYRRPNTHLSLPLPFTRPPTEGTSLDQQPHSTSLGSSNRAHRSRRYFHHTSHRSVGAAPPDLPSYTNHQGANEYFCQPPPAYETIHPPTYAETMLRDGAPDPQIPPPNNNSTSHHNSSSNNNNTNTTNDGDK